jgi:hypothetical protein
MSAPSYAQLQKFNFERNVKIRMSELEVEHRDGFAVSTAKVNFEAVNRSIAAGIREAVEVSQDRGVTTIRHRLVRI